MFHGCTETCLAKSLLFRYVALDKAECTKMVDIYTLTVSIFYNEKIQFVYPRGVAS